MGGDDTVTDETCYWFIQLAQPVTKWLKFLLDQIPTEDRWKLLDISSARSGLLIHCPQAHLGPCAYPPCIAKIIKNPTRFSHHFRYSTLPVQLMESLDTMSSLH